MGDILKDLRYSVRALIKRPGTSSLAIIALALGIGLTTTMFSIVQAAFLRGLPFERSDRIMYVGRGDAKNPGRPAWVPSHDFVDWRKSQQSFEELAAFDTTSAVVSDGLAPERYRAARLTANTLHLLRVTPVAGREFTEADCQPGAPAVALISHRVWTNQFRQDSAVINKAVRINGVPTVVIGVLPPQFGFPQTQDLWLPLEIKLGSKRGEGQSLQVFGRLKDGVSLQQANTGMAAIARQLAQEYPENKDTTAEVVPYVRRFIGAQVIDTLSAMLGAVFGVMLIACANVTNLQLARAAERTKEVAVRTALGAGRWRIVRQLLIEGLVLSGAGALIGLALAQVGTQLFMRAIVDTNPPFWIVVHIDQTVLLFVTALTVVAALVSSLVPGLRATRQDLNSTLKDEGRANTGIRMGRFTRWLVVSEIFLSCCLLVVSGLMIKGVVILGTIKYPFATTDIFQSSLAVDNTKYPKSADVARLNDRIEERLAHEPGVRRVALATGVPTPGGGSTFQIEGETYAPDGPKPLARRLTVSTGYFDVLRVNVLRGRLFGPGDVTGAPQVVVIGEDFARRYFPKGDAMGRRIMIDDYKSTGDSRAQWWTITGVVPALAVAPASGDTVETMYVPIAQAPTYGQLLLSTAGDPSAMTGTLRKALLDVDPDIALFSNGRLETALAQRGWPFRVFGTLFMCFGVAALVLASAGLYGVMAFSVRRRTQEIGVRMALGADRPRVLRMILWQGMWRVGLGIVLGIVPAYYLAGLLKLLLFNVQQLDPLVYSVTIGSLLGAGVAASLVPALRAASVDPLVALRHD